MRKNCKNRSSPEPPPKKSSETDHTLRDLLIVISLSIFPFLSSLSGDFVFDDAETIVNNPIVNGKDSLTQIFNRDFWGRPVSASSSHKSYRPVTTLTFWLNYYFHGTSTFGYHATNILCHMAVSVLFYKLARQLQSLFEIQNVAITAAVLFAVHPVHTEAVANVTGRAELLMTLFSLAAMIHFCNKREIDASFFLLVALSTFSKEQGVMTIPIIFCIDLLTKRCNVFKTTRMFLMFIAITVFRLFINGFQSAKFTKLDNPTAFIDSPFYRAVNYSYIWLYHMYLLILPANLCFDYSMGCIPPISSLSDVRALSPVLISVALIIGVKYRNECRMLSFSVLLGTLAFVPSSNIFFTVGFTVAERILYLPSVGFCLFCAVLLKKTARHCKNADLIALSVLLLAVSKTYKRSAEWKTELSLYSTGLRVCPMNAKIHYNLGKVMGDSGLTKDAEKNYWNAIKLNPSYEQALNNLGNLLEKSGDSKTAESLLSRAVTLRPSFAVAWMNLGVSQMNLNKFQDAEKSLKNSLLIRPHSAHCLFNLGVLYQKTNRELLAMSTWRNATLVDPSHSQSWTNLFVVLDHLGYCSEVIDLASEALKSVPNESRVHMQIGSCFAKSGEPSEAEKHILTAIDLNPTSALYHANLGVLFQRTNRLKEAETEYQVALMMDSHNSIAKQNLVKLKQHRYQNSTRP